MSFLVLNVANRFRHAVARLMLNINQHVFDRLRHIVVAQVANRVRLQTGRAAEWKVRHERDGVRRRQVYDYIGAASNSEARRRAIDSLEAHARRAIEEARHRIEAGRAAVGSAGRGRGADGVGHDLV